MADVLEALQEFDDFRQNVLPKLQQMVKDGAPPEEILKFAASMAAAKMVTKALISTDKDSYNASKDILDRTLGKAKERHEHEHRYKNLKSEELDAIILSQVADLDDEDSQKNH